MKGRTPTAEEQRYMDRVRDLGCIVCRLFHGAQSPAEIHHLDGKTKPGAHFKTIGLCVPHHRGGSNSDQCVSRHPWKGRFEQRYLPEYKLLEKTQELVGVNCGY